MNSFTIERYKSEPDGIGGTVQEWEAHTIVDGYMDMLTNRDGSNQNTFIPESTHVLITDHANYDVTKFDKLVVRGVDYEITFVDDPVGLGHHLEIYLKQVT